MPTYNEKYVQKWIGYLNDIDREMSRLAAQRLGESKNPNAVPALVGTLRNRPDDVRLAAVRSLGQIGDAGAVNALVVLLDDMNPMIASTAADALGDIGDDSAVPALRKVLREYKKSISRHNQIHGDQRGLYTASVSALKRIGTRDALKAVEKYTTW